MNHVPQYKRKKKIVHPRFQWRVIAVPLILSALVCVSIVGGMIWYAHSTEQKITHAVEVVEDVTEKEDQIVTAFLKFAGTLPARGLSLDASRVTTHHTENMTQLRETYPLLRSHTQQLFLVLAGLGVIFVVQFLLLYWYLLRITHKVSGPVYVIDQILQDVQNGKEPALRDLREGDEFVEMYARLRDVLRQVKDEQEKCEKKLKRAKKAKKKKTE